MVKKSTKPKTKPKAKKPIAIRLKKGYTEQDFLDQVPTIFKKLKTAHRSSETVLIEFHVFTGIVPR
jgi:hypothetical protein